MSEAGQGLEVGAEAPDFELRDQHGGISSVDQLDEIDGIGPATMESLQSGLQP